MESASKITAKNFEIPGPWPKNDSANWSRKNIFETACSEHFCYIGTSHYSS